MSHMMTDTVNVPREPTGAMIDVAIGHIGGGSTFNEEDRREIAGDIYRAMLAAAPKAEPADPQELLDGYEIGKREEPEAPKVEQGLVGYLEGAAIADLRNGFASVTATVYSKAESGCEAIYTHPAPASDELLEAAEDVMSYMLEAWPTLATTSPVQRLQHAIAKHKGPQS